MTRSVVDDVCRSPLFVRLVLRVLDDRMSIDDVATRLEISVDTALFLFAAWVRRNCDIEVVQ